MAAMNKLTLPKVKKILQRSTVNICDNVDLTNTRLLKIMQDKNGLSLQDGTRIMAQVVDDDKCHKLIGILTRKPLNSYHVFMNALREIGRDDVYDDIVKIEVEEGYIRLRADDEDDTASTKRSSKTSPRSNVDKKRPKVDEPDSRASTSHSEDSSYIHVEPDSNGYYTDVHVKAAKPTVEQLTAKKYYNMTSPAKGRAYILNNSYFPKREEKKQHRHGSKQDFESMKHLFTELGYEIVSHEDLTAKCIRKTIKAFVKEFNDTKTEYLSAVTVLMSHGNTGYIAGTDDKMVEMKEIQKVFERCVNLRGKPKMFFMQFCRGGSYRKVDSDYAGPSSNQNPEDMKVEADHDFARDIPADADMYFAYASPDGYLSMRNRITGSWFIQAITEVFLAYAHKEDLDSLMNMVTHRVTNLKGLYDPLDNGNFVRIHVTPTREVRLRKTLLFLPKYPPLS